MRNVSPRRITAAVTTMRGGSSAEGIVRLAFALHRADAALRLARRAERRAEIHQRLVEVEHVPHRQHSARHRPEMTPHGVRFGVTVTDEDAEQYAGDVRVENRFSLTERETQHRAGGVLPDPLERPQRLLVVGELAAVASHRFPGNSMQAARTNVVAERTPGRGDVGLGGIGQRLERRKFPEPFGVFRQDTIDLRLLQHHFGNEDVVRIGGLPPRKIASVDAVPREKATSEPLPARRGRKRRVSLAGSYNQTVKIYTRTGDSGETGLFDGTRVSKADPRVSAYGDVDELNAWLGLARASLSDTQLSGMVEQIQRDLFALGAR